MQIRVQLERDRSIYERYPSQRLRILLSGSSGLIGSRLSPFLSGAGHQVVHLVRKHPLASNEIFWNPQTGDVPKEQFENFDAVIHLAGKNIMARRWNARVKEEIFISRCRDTWLLSHVLQRLERPPKTLITASAAGYYGNRGDEILTEESPPGTGFLANLCQKWEEATQVIEERGVRTIHTRFGAVLSKEGGMLAKLLTLFRLGFGAVLGNGRQYVPWIALDDLVYGIYHVLMTSELKGPVNFTTPNPTTQAEFSRALAKALHRPCFLRLPAPLLRIAVGEIADEVLLTSAKVLPKKLLNSGFRFKHSTISSCL